MDLTEGTVVADRFRLIRVLGEGSMGAVWVAHHITLDVACAIKFIRADAAASEEIRARFEQEARAAAKLRSPHIVQILDHGVWEQLPYIAMELLEGEDLETRLGRMYTLSPRETAGIVAQVARALTKAHAAGLIHRDLKPANIFLVRDDDREIAKVLDFGISKSTLPSGDSLATRSGSLVGTPAYMSPEQAEGTQVVDHRTDLWSLAVVTYQCLTGQRPFKSAALGDLLVKIIVKDLPVPSRVATVPPGFDAFWARAASRDPAGRYQTAKELADALAEALEQPVDESLRVGLATEAGATVSLPAPALRPVDDELEVALAPTRKRARAVGVVVALGVVGAVAGGLLLLRDPSPTPLAPPANGSAPAPSAIAPTPSAVAPVPAVVAPAPSVIASPPAETARAAPTVSAAPPVRPAGKVPAVRPTGAPAAKPPGKRYDDGI